MNTLLVIGNGFDRTAGAKTSYGEFFESEFYAPTKQKVFDWISKGEAEAKGTFGLDYSNMAEYDFTCWDLVFCMESKYNNKFKGEIRWCDIESAIHDSLTLEPSAYSFSWRHTFDLLHDKFYEQDPVKKTIAFPHANIAVKIMIYFLGWPEWKEYFQSKDKFFNKLLDELKAFERHFGFYIYEQTRSDDYIDRAQNLINRLIKPADRKVQIDSFNYSNFSNGFIDIRHINGDCSDPIFGIDLSMDEEDEFPEYRCFTKTSRRIYQDAHKLNADTRWEPLVVDKAVVFGHSLNRMDYDYFYYLFTLLKYNTFDIEKMGSVEFVYKIYNYDRKDEILDNYANAIYSLLNYYEGYVSRTNQHILINLLRFSGKLKIKELES